VSLLLGCSNEAVARALLCEAWLGWVRISWGSDIRNRSVLGIEYEFDFFVFVEVQRKDWSWVPFFILLPESVRSRAVHLVTLFCSFWRTKKGYKKREELLPFQREL
jgi:hypothetical protein